MLVANWYVAQTMMQAVDLHGATCYMAFYHHMLAWGRSTVTFPYYVAICPILPWLQTMKCKQRRNLLTSWKRQYFCSKRAYRPFKKWQQEADSHPVFLVKVKSEMTSDTDSLCLHNTVHQIKPHSTDRWFTRKTWNVINLKSTFQSGRTVTFFTKQTEDENKSWVQLSSNVLTENLDITRSDWFLIWSWCEVTVLLYVIHFSGERLSAWVIAHEPSSS